MVEALKLIIVKYIRIALAEYLHSVKAILLIDMLYKQPKPYNQKSQYFVIIKQSFINGKRFSTKITIKCDFYCFYLNLLNN